MYALTIALCLFCITNAKTANFDVPDVLIEALKPKGLRVSIPDKLGIQLFAFHGKINEEMIGREAGRFSVDIRRARNGRWTFFDKNARLKVGDVLHYWVHVRYNNVGYEKDFEPVTITELMEDDSDMHSTTSKSSQVFEVPDVLIEALVPKGLRVSIPDEDGIELFAFHGKINEEMIGRESGRFSIDIRRAENGRWTFFDPNARLKLGDSLHYWIHVRYDGVGYEKDGEPFTITELVEANNLTYSTTTKSVTAYDFDIPDVLIEVLTPKGLRVSIPDEEGIQLLAFHGKINEEMMGREAGRFSVDIRRPQNGRWTFFDKNARLQIGDTLHYWIHVRYHGVGYEKDGEPFTVTETVDANSTAYSTTTTSVNGQGFDVPDVLIEVLTPKGLRVSIPDEEGVQLFAFHGKINEEMIGREAGRFSVDIRRAQNGRWTFFDKNARLKVGDILHYWIHVRYDGVGYEKDGEPFTVTELVNSDSTIYSTTTKSVTAKGFDIPDLSIEVLKPKGLRVSIPDRDGIQLFGFHGKINEKMIGRESGRFSADVGKAKNGRWTFFDKNARLKIGDVLQYWVHVRYEGVGYEKDGEPFTVMEFVEADGTIFSTTMKTVNAQDFVVPDVLIEVIKPKGLKVSIPDQNGMQLFGFHGKINEEMIGRESGRFSVDIRKSKDGRWTFFDKNARLKVGDVLHYWIHVRYNGVGYEKGGEPYMITELVRMDNLVCLHNTTTPFLCEYGETKYSTKTNCTSTQISQESSTENQQSFDFPDVLIEVLKPTGLRVSIPDEEGMQLFAFHGKINKKMRGREAGKFSTDVRKAENGRWTFFDKNARLQIGDVLYYWIHVRFDDIGYEKDGEPFVITELIESDGSVYTTTIPEGCELGQVQFDEKLGCKGTLIFEEYFDSFDKTKWKPEVKFAGSPDYEFVIYRDDPKNLYIENNALHIQPVTTDEIFGVNSVHKKLDLNNSCTGNTPTQCAQTPKGAIILPPTTSAQISTIDSFTFMYGIIEVKAKLPKGDWLYPEINLVPKCELYGHNYASGRIRIAFVHGNEKLNNELYAGCSLGDSDAPINIMKRMHSENNWTEDYHIFRVEWSSDHIVLKVDNTTFGTIYPPEGGFVTDKNFAKIDRRITAKWKKGTAFAPFDQEMYIQLGVGVGGNSFADTIPNKPWNNYDVKSQLRFYEDQANWKQTWDSNSKLIVEYIKVWAV